MRQLNKTVLAGGVVYPAGSPATPELEAAVTNPDNWTGEPEEVLDDGDVPARPGYDVWSKAELSDEVDKRNADRDPEGEDYIVVEAPRNKPDFVAALAADDAPPAD